MIGVNIVIDTSILISALIGKEGPSREVLRKCLQGHYVPLLSNALFLEYEAVSKRERILDICPLSSMEIQELLNAVYSVSKWVSIYYLWRPNLPDESDNFVIELAIAGNAKYLVTNNVKDMKASELLFPELQILKPEELLREI